MPYHLHDSDAEPSTGQPFDTKPEALAQRANGQTVTFIASADQRQEWQERERARFASGTYIAVPWANSLGTTLDHHYAHISLRHAGMIAYTPDDEYGVNDRQLRVRPGKYLAQFASWLNAEKIEAFTAACRAIHGGLKIATTADDIVAVYTHGPSSCMAHSGRYASDCYVCSRDEDRTHYRYDTNGIHPATVYGDSDLAVAYLGTLSAVSARCLIWPAEKQYNRIYGDTALRAILESHGYSHADHFAGAKIRRISLDDDRWVMPYLDCGNGVDRESRQWWTVSRYDGQYSAKETNGVIGEPANSCAECGDRCDHDEVYCQSCSDLSWTCERCEHSEVSEDSHYHAETTLCESCYSRYAWTCAECGSEEINDRRDRNTPHVINDDVTLCSDCYRHYEPCDECDSYFDTRDHDTCPDCPDDDETEAEPEQPVYYGPDMPADRTIAIAVGDSADRLPVFVLARLGPFAIHRRYKADGYSVTHVRTGLSVHTCEAFDLAFACASHLIADGISWEFDSRDDAPAETRTHALAVLAHFSEVSTHVAI